MKIVSWNCSFENGGFSEKKFELISQHELCKDMDILVIQECTYKEKITFGSQFEYSDWYGDGKDSLLGIGVFSKKFQFELSPEYKFTTPYRYIVPYKFMIKDTELMVFAVWTKDSIDKIYKYEYEKNIYGAFKDERFSELLKFPSIVIGDFNTFAKTDNQRLSDQNSKLRSYGLHNCAEGENAELPTFISPKDGPGTDDFCYATEQIVKTAKFSVLGRSSDFDNLSDHCPIIVDFDL
ncbi:hypothetical protein AGMMS49579_07340 [Spirochaetia bacterium]|nr:hypothetical protein AGMMS49579_07340 [Spirochaetia bacterium]